MEIQKSVVCSDSEDSIVVTSSIEPLAKDDDCQLSEITKRSSNSAKKVYYDVSMLGLSFCLIFTGYHVAQSFVTTLYRDEGFGVLCVIYLAYCIGCLCAPAIHQMMERIAGPGRQERLCMSAASLGYVAFVFSLISGSTALIYVSGFVKGISSGILWVSQGVYINKILSTETDSSSVKSTKIVGLAVGLFFMVYNINGVIGNGITIALLQMGTSVQMTLLAMGVVSSVGALMTLLVSDSPVVVQKARKQVVDSTNTLSSTLSAEKQSNRLSIFGEFKSVCSILKNRKVQFLMPYFILQGISLAYTYGNYPAFISQLTSSGDNAGSTFDTSQATNIAYGFLLYSVGSVIGSMLWGKVYDYFKQSLYPLLTCHSILTGLNFSVIVYLIFAEDKSIILPGFVVVGFVFGLSDFLINAIINNSINSHFDAADINKVFTCYRVLFSIGFVIASVVGSILPNVNMQSASNWDKYGWVIIACLDIGFTAISVLCGFFMEQRYGSQIRRSSLPVAFH
ncbi:hypothetical protein MP228_008440 [Amoeboaphelidium protococcarum]|nr:hypothetical protein MP228_008440 [Amoeboaphelidium protococcarum]